MSGWDFVLELFSALIFVFAVRESRHSVRLLVKKLRTECDLCRLDARKALRIVTRMAISIGPAGYYGMHLLREFGLV